jgi:hypothetical protein
MSRTDPPPPFFARSFVFIWLSKLSTAATVAMLPALEWPSLTVPVELYAAESHLILDPDRSGRLYPLTLDTGLPGPAFHDGRRKPNRCL